MLTIVVFSGIIIVFNSLLIISSFSFFIAHIFKVNSHLIMYVFTLLVSLTIETTQLYIGRAFDVDDILLNLIGVQIYHLWD